MKHLLSTKIKRQELWYLIVLTCISVFFVSCADDMDSKIPSVNDANLTLQVRAYGANGENYSSEAGKIDREVRIDDLVVLVFDENDEFIYRAACTTPQFIESKEKGSGDYEVSVRLNKTEDVKHSLTLLANYHIDSYDLHQYVGEKKQDVLHELCFEGTVGEKPSFVWKQEHVGLPMWGETQPCVIDNRTNFGPINLLRAVAKIDISMHSACSNQYQLKHTYAFNALNTGTIVPDKSKFSKELPTLPSEISASDLVQTAVQANTSIFYIPENISGSKDDTQHTTCFVVGLLNTASSQLKYYRLDLLNEFNNQLEKIDTDLSTSCVLRNKWYTIEIVEVKGEGADTPEEALITEVDCKIKLSIKDWEIYTKRLKPQGHEWFEIQERDTDFPFFSFGDAYRQIYNIKEIVIKTNLPREYLSFLKDDIAYTAKIQNKFYATLSENQAYRKSGEHEYTLQITPIPSAYHDEDIVNFDFYIGSTKVPMTISLPEKVVPSKLAPDIQAIRHGTYISSRNPNRGVLNNSHYIELRIPFGLSDEIKIGSEIIAFTNEVFNTGKGPNGFEFCTIKSPNSTNVFTHKVTVDDIVVIENEEEKKLEKFVVVRLQGKGKPLRSNAANYDRDTQFKIHYYTYTDKVLYEGTYELFGVPVFDYQGDKEIVTTPNVLFIADGYNFNPEKILFRDGIDNGSWWDFLNPLKWFESRNDNYNLARLLYNQSIFGLNNDTEIAMEPFELGKTIHVISNLSELSSPEKLKKYDIVFYISSSVADDLYRSSSYAEVLVNLVRKKELVFVQVPARTGLTDGYVDPVMTRLLDTDVKVTRTSVVNKNQRVIKLLNLDEFNDYAHQNYYYTKLLGRLGDDGLTTIQSTGDDALSKIWTDVEKISNLASLFSRILGIEADAVVFPKSPDNGTFNMVYDFSYIDMKETDFPPGLIQTGVDYFVKELIPKDGIFNSSFFDLMGSRIVTLKAKDYNYMWLGSPFIFSDFALNVEGFGPRTNGKNKFFPLRVEFSINYGAIPGGSTTTKNALFFVSLMHWAIDKNHAKYLVK